MTGQDVTNLAPVRNSLPLTLPKSTGGSLLASKRLWPALSFLWLFLISALNALRVSPKELNADIVLNSVMALQNLTPFYWGQNRLLNVLPLLVSPIRNPSLNLVAVLLITSLSFFGLLYTFAHIAVRAVHGKNAYIVFCVFVIASGSTVIVLTAEGMANITIGHIEYSMPVLIATLTFWLLLQQLHSKPLWVRTAVVVPLSFVAVGMNPTVAFPIVYASLILTAYRRHLDQAALLMGASSVAAYVLWREVVRRISPTPYEDFSLVQIPGGVRQATTELIGITNLATLFLLIALILLMAGAQVLQRNRGSGVRWSLAVLLGTTSTAFSLIWILIVSGNEWIMINEFSARYFTFSIFGFLFATIVLIAALLVSLAPKVTLAMAATVGALLVFVDRTPFVGFDDYAIFEEVGALTQPGSHLYAGDYWLVWPSVFRDMRAGEEAFGFGFRAQGNQTGTTRYTMEMVEKDGFASVYCLRETTTECVSQISTLLGSIEVLGVRQLEQGATRIDFRTPSAG